MKQMNKDQMLLTLLLNGYDVSYRKLSIANVSKYVKGKKHYQVHLDTGDKISELYKDPVDAIYRFIDLRKEAYNG